MRQFIFKINIWPMLIVLFSSCVSKNKDLFLNKYGIVGDGKTDNTTGFTRLFNDAKEGSTITLPEGNFIINDALVINKKGVKLIGQGENTVIQFSGKKDIYKKYGHRTGMINIMADNVSISKIKFDQNFRSTGRNDGDKPVIGCIIIGYYDNNNMKTSGVTINNCIFYDYYGDSVAGHLSRTDNLTIDNNKFYSAYDVENWKQAGVEGEQAISVYIGQNISIKNNEIYAALDDAISTLFKVSNCTISGNTITTTGGRIAVNGCTDCTVTNNNIKYIEKGASAIMISFIPGKVLTISSNVKIIKNKITIEKGVELICGILVFGAGDNITIAENEIINNSEFKLKGGICVRKRTFMPKVSKNGKEGSLNKNQRDILDERDEEKLTEYGNDVPGTGKSNTSSNDNNKSNKMKGNRSANRPHQLSEVEKIKSGIGTTLTPKNVLISDNKISGSETGLLILENEKSDINKNITSKNNVLLDN